MIFDTLSDIQKSGLRSVMVTIVGTKGSAPRAPGSKMIVTEKQFFGSIGGGNLEWMALKEARELLSERGESKKVLIPLSSGASQCCGGSVEIFLDVIQPPPRLLIFGAGHVTQALLEVLAGTDFSCTVVDERPEWIEQAQMKKTQLSQLSLTAVCENPLSWAEKFSAWSAEDVYVLVMTHDHALDEQLVENILEKKNKYLGLIGSKTKKQRFEQRFLQREMNPELLHKLRCPVGLPLGGKSPKEVAISIGGELLQFLHEGSRSESKLHSSSSRVFDENGSGQSTASL